MDCALTCFQQDNLIVLAKVHEAGNAFGKFHHILNGISDVVRALLPHPLSRLCGTKIGTLSRLDCNFLIGLKLAALVRCVVPTANLVLEHTGFLRRVLHPGESLHVFSAVLTRLQVRLDDALSDAV